MPEETTTIDQTITIDDTQTTIGAPAATEPALEATGVELNTNIVTTDNEQLPIVRLGENNPLLPTAWKGIVQNPTLNTLLGTLPMIARYVKENRKSKSLTFDKALNYNAQKDVATITNKDDTITLEHFSKIARYSISTAQLFDAAVLVFSRQMGEKKALFSFPFDDYFSWRGLEDKNEARKQAKEDLSILYELDIRCEGQHNFGMKNNRLLSTAELSPDGKVFTFGFGAKLYEAIKNERSYLYYPMKLILGVNSKQFRYAYYLAHKFAYDKGYSFTSNTTLAPYKVATLVASCNFPAPDSASVKNDNMKLKRPFISNIASLRRDEIDNILFLNARGGKVSDDEAAKMKLADFLELRVKVFWNEYPERQEPQQATSN